MGFSLCFFVGPDFSRWRGEMLFLKFLTALWKHRNCWCFLKGKDLLESFSLKKHVGILLFCSFAQWGILSKRSTPGITASDEFWAIFFATSGKRSPSNCGLVREILPKNPRNIQVKDVQKKLPEEIMVTHFRIEWILHPRFLWFVNRWWFYGMNDFSWDEFITMPKTHHLGNIFVPNHQTSKQIEVKK